MAREWHAPRVHDVPAALPPALPAHTAPSLDSPLRQPGTYLSAHREVNHLEPPDDINVLVAISHKAFPMNATDAYWEKYRLGEVFNIKVDLRVQVPSRPDRAAAEDLVAKAH